MHIPGRARGPNAVASSDCGVLAAGARAGRDQPEYCGDDQDREDRGSEPTLVHESLDREPEPSRVRCIAAAAPSAFDAHLSEQVPADPVHVYGAARVVEEANRLMMKSRSATLSVSSRACR